MSSGERHEKATKYLSIPFGIILGLLLGLRCGLISGLGFLIGGIWLSPDLDTKSNALKHWGIFKFLWWPYRKIIAHRSIFSHGPLIGTTIRVTYIFFIAYIATQILQPFSAVSSKEFLEFCTRQISRHPSLVGAFLIGLEGSVWLHLIQDGDPLPIEWKKMRQ